MEDMSNGKSPFEWQVLEPLNWAMASVALSSPYVYKGSF